MHQGSRNQAILWRTEEEGKTFILFFCGVKFKKISLIGTAVFRKRVENPSHTSTGNIGRVYMRQEQGNIVRHWRQGSLIYHPKQGIL